MAREQRLKPDENRSIGDDRVRIVLDQSRAGFQQWMSGPSFKLRGLILLVVILCLALWGLIIWVVVSI